MTKNQLKKDIQAIIWGLAPFYEDDQEFIGIDSQQVFTIDEFCEVISMINNYCFRITNTTDESKDFITIHDIKSMNSISSIIDTLWSYKNIKEANR